jgi:phosphate-selective porin OprO and OprP
MYFRRLALRSTAADEGGGSMSLRNQLAGGVALGATLLLMKPAAAQTSAEEIGRLQQQIQELQQKSQQLQEQLRDLQNQMQKSQTAPPQAAAPSAPSAAAPTQAASPPSATVSGEPRVTLYPAKGPAFTTADGQTSIQLASRMQFDVGDYVNVKPQSKFSSPANLTSGVNARRARIGILGKFYGDWDYALIYDFGGSADSLVNSGANTSGIENAYITYTGFRPLVIDAGYQNVPWTLDEATSSTDILFLERASPAAVAFNIAGGDFRSAVDVRYVKDRYFAGLWATGPVSGQPHNVGEQFGALGRFSVQALQSGDASLHLGVDVESLLKAPNVNGLRTLTLSDRPELRIDPTVVLNTGALINVRNSEVYGGELAASYQNLFFQSEYYHFIVQRDALPTLNFDGGYAEASWVLTGEQHTYVPATGAYSGILPNRPMSLTGAGWGAFEVAARYSVIDLNDRFTPGVAATATQGVAGGKQTIYTLGFNWYVDSYVRFSLNYLHGIIDKKSASVTTGPLGIGTGLKFDAIAARGQVAF